MRLAHSNYALSSFIEPDSVFYLAHFLIGCISALMHVLMISSIVIFCSVRLLVFSSVVLLIGVSLAVHLLLLIKGLHLNFKLIGHHSKLSIPLVPLRRLVALVHLEVKHGTWHANA